MTEQAPEVQTLPASTEPPADALASLLSKLESALSAGESALVLLSRLTATGRVPVESIPGDKFDPFTLGAKYGAGRYVAQLKVGAKYAAQAMFPVEAPAAPAPAPASAPAADPAPAGGVSMMSLLLAMLQDAKQQAAAAQAQMMTMVQALVSRPADLSVRDLLPLIAQKKGGDLADMVAALGQLDSLRGDGGGGETSDLAAIMQGLPALAAFAQQPPAPAPAPARRQLPAKPPHRPRPAPAPAAPTPAVVAAPAPAPAAPAFDPFAAVRAIQNPAIRSMVGAFYAGLEVEPAAAAVLEALGDEAEQFAALAEATPIETLLANVAAEAPMMATNADLRDYAARVVRAAVSMLDEDDDAPEVAGAIGGEAKV